MSESRACVISQFPKAFQNVCTIGQSQERRNGLPDVFDRKSTFHYPLFQSCSKTYYLLLLDGFWLFDFTVYFPPCLAHREVTFLGNQSLKDSAAKFLQFKALTLQSVLLFLWWSGGWSLGEYLIVTMWYRNIPQKWCWLRIWLESRCNLKNCWHRSVFHNVMWVKNSFIGLVPVINWRICYAYQRIVPQSHFSKIRYRRYGRFVIQIRPYFKKFS